MTTTIIIITTVIIAIVATIEITTIIKNQKIIKDRKDNDDQYDKTINKIKNDPTTKLNSQDEINIMIYQVNRATERAERLSSQLTYANIWNTIIGIYCLIQLIIIIITITVILITGIAITDVIQSLLQ